MSLYREHYALQQEKDRLLLDYSTWQNKYDITSEKVPDSSRFKVKGEYPEEFGAK